MRIQNLLAVAFVAICVSAPRVLCAHCDTLDGPVVADAKKALEKNDITPALKWIKKSNEKELHNVFEKTQAVRAKAPEAKELADTYFFETLVRLHRAGEGAPYAGLKPVGTKLEPGVAEADKALESGSADRVITEATSHVGDAMRRRYHEASEKKKHADESVEAGRAYVASYVAFMHYVEAVYAMAGHGSAHGENHESTHGEKTPAAPVMQTHESHEHSAAGK